MRPCALCKDKAIRWGLCHMHSQRLWRWGDPFYVDERPRTHGLHSTYNNGRRCEPCRLANADHHRERKHRLGILKTYYAGATEKREQRRKDSQKVHHG